MVIDDFSAPQNGLSYVISLNSPDPLLVKTADPGILGGERDLLVDVSGTPGPVSAVGVVGGNLYVFGSVGAGAGATLQYDGLDADVAGPPAGLTNALSLGGVDLTGGGTNTGFRLDFLSIDGGAGTTLSVSLTLTSAGGSATFVGAIPENPSASSYIIPFSSFTPSGSFTFTQATSIDLVLNAPAIHDVDFQLDSFVIPEPFTLAPLALGLLAWPRRRRAAD